MMIMISLWKMSGILQRWSEDSGFFISHGCWPNLCLALRFSGADRFFVCTSFSASSISSSLTVWIFFIFIFVSICDCRLIISQHTARGGGPDGDREATRCSSVTNRWQTPVLALTAQLAANEPTVSSASSASAACRRLHDPERSVDRICQSLSISLQNFPG